MTSCYHYGVSPLFPGHCASIWDGCFLLLCALCSLVFFSVGHNMSESLAFFTIKMLNGDPENVPFRQFIVESP
jgi:hypothetical protein